MHARRLAVLMIFAAMVAGPSGAFQNVAQAGTDDRDIVATQVKVGKAGLWDVTVGDGAVFVADTDGSVWWIDPTSGTTRDVSVRSGATDPTGRTRKAIPVDASDLQFGEGYLWADALPKGLSRILTLEPSADDPRVVDGELTPGPNAIVEPTGGEPIELFELAVGEGAAWALQWQKTGKTFSLRRIDPTTGEGEQLERGTNPEPQLAVGEGAVWVTVEKDCTETVTGRNGTEERQYSWPELSQVNPATGSLVREPIPLVEPCSDATTGFRVTDIAVGEGAVWVAAATDGLISVDPATGEVTRHSDRYEVTLGSVAVGEGAVWGLDSFGGKTTLYQFDPSSGELTRTIKLKARVDSYAVGEGSIWMTGSSEPKLWRVEIPSR